jgi:septal ring factor EnvC (AmiA/AmiB activator)
MEYYLAVSPAKAPKDGFQDWLAVLREVDYLNKSKTEMEKKNQSLRAQNDKLQAALEKLQKTNSHLRDEVTTLKESNNKMIETIERLKILDYQMEEKRSLIK